MKIPRGSTYHNISEGLKDLFTSTYSNLNNIKIIEDFENKFAFYNESKHSVAFPFARTALNFAIKTLNIEKNSEIIMSPITIKAMLDVVISNGLKPIFVDLDKNDLTYDISDLKKKITPNTRLILITYLFGIVPNLKKFEIIKNKKIRVIEDFSQCLNGKFNRKKTGNYSDIAIYSCSSIKTLDTYGGGLAVTNNKDFYLHLKKFQNTLDKPKRLFLIKKILINLIRTILTNMVIFNYFTFYLIKYLNQFNKNYKMLGDRDKSPIKKMPVDWFRSYTSFQANKGILFLKKINESDKIRKNLSKKYIDELKNIITFPLGFNQDQNVYWQFLVYLNDPKIIRDKLLKKGIDTSSTSLEQLNKLSKYGFDFNLKNVNQIYNKTLFLPCFSKLNVSNINKVIFEIINLKEKI